MLDMNPAAVLASLAAAIFSDPPDPTIRGFNAILSFALAAWGGPRLLLGVHGWMRHLPFSQTGHRRVLIPALVALQLPLLVSWILLALIAHAAGTYVRGILPLLLLSVSAAFAALPGRLKWIRTPMCAAAALLFLFGDRSLLIPGIALLVTADILIGSRWEPARHGTHWKAAGALLHFRICWRALGWHLAGCYLGSLLAVAATLLFLANNDLPEAARSGAVRFGGSMGAAFFLSGAASKLALRRPAWPWLRSLPSSSGRRIMEDSLFFAVHTLPLVLIVAWVAPRPALSVLSLVPLLATRASAALRTIPERRSGSSGFLLEAFAVSAILALLPWTALLWLPASLPASLSARRADQRLKPTRWRERRHSAEGDSLSWSAR